MRKFSELSKSLKSGRDWLDWCAAQFERSELFFGHGTDDPLSEALAVIMHVRGIAPDDVDKRIDQAVNMDEAKRIFDIACERIETRRPLPYITGEAWFAGLKFNIDARALVPRSPFAELIGNKFRPWAMESAVRHVLDMCTGCGCIAVATAVHMPRVKVDAVDISADALELALENVRHHGVGDRVQLLKSDGLQSVPAARYDLVLCNPPYVDAAAMQTLPAEYRFEPVLGLAAGDDGLEFVRQFLAELPDYLAEEGQLFVEVGAGAAALDAAYPELPFTWLEFEHGGEGIFTLSRGELVAGLSRD